MQTIFVAIGALRVKISEKKEANMMLLISYQVSDPGSSLPSCLTLKATITTAADDKFCDIFPIFGKNKV